MSLVAAPFAFLTSLYFFMGLLTLRCAAESSLVGDVFFARPTKKVVLESTQDNSETSPAALEAESSSPVATGYNTPRKPTRRLEVSGSANEAAAVINKRPVPARDDASEKLTAARKKPAAELRQIASPESRSSGGNGSKRQLRPSGTISAVDTAGRAPLGAARSAVPIALSGEMSGSPSLGASCAESAAITTRAGMGDPESAATTVAPAASATVLVETSGRTIATAPTAPMPQTSVTIAKDTVIGITPAGLPSGLDRDRAATDIVAPDPATPLGLLAEHIVTTQTPPDSIEVSTRGVTDGVSFHRILKGQENSSCRRVAVEAQSVCKKLKPTQRTYTCTKQVVDKICEEVPFVIQKMCTKTFYERKPFKCDRVEYKSECIQKKETTKTECVQTVIKGEAYPCPKIDYVTKCNKKPTLTPSVCKHEVQKEFHYPCERTVKEEQCAEVEKEVDQICEEDNVVTEKYDCSKTVYVKKCSPAAGTAVSAIRATGVETPAATPEEKAETPLHGEGEKGPRRLRKVTTPAEAVVVPLPKAHVSVEMCVDVPQVKRKTCTREVVKKERRPCKGVKKEIQCSNVTKVIHEVCSKVKKVMEPYACTKTEMQQECSTVAKQMEDTCTREVPVDEKGPCEIEIFKNECVPVPVRIPDVCFEARPRTEVYDCSEDTTKSVCKEELKEVEHQCVQTEYREVEYACTQLEHVEKCVVAETKSPTVSSVQPIHKYSKNQHQGHLVMTASEAAYEDEEEGPQEFEAHPGNASLPMLQPLMKKEFVTVLNGTPVKKAKMKWKEKLHKLGDPDLGEEEKQGGKAEEKKTEAEEGEHGKK